LFSDETIRGTSIVNDDVDLADRLAVDIRDLDELILRFVLGYTSDSAVKLVLGRNGWDGPVVGWRPGLVNRCTSWHHDGFGGAPGNRGRNRERRGATVLVAGAGSDRPPAPPAGSTALLGTAPPAATQLLRRARARGQLLHARAPGCKRDRLGPRCRRAPNRASASFSPRCVATSANDAPNSCSISWRYGTAVERCSWLQQGILDDDSWLFGACDEGDAASVRMTGANRGRTRYRSVCCALRPVRATATISP